MQEVDAFEEEITISKQQQQQNFWSPPWMMKVKTLIFGAFKLQLENTKSCCASQNTQIKVSSGLFVWNGEIRPGKSGERCKCRFRENYRIWENFGGKSLHLKQVLIFFLRSPSKSYSAPHFELYWRKFLKVLQFLISQKTHVLSWNVSHF